MKIIKILLLAVTLLTINVANAQTVNWKIAETWPKDFPLFGDAVKKMIQNVDTLSGGKFKIVSETKEVHKKALNILQMVRDDEYEMGHTASYYYKGLDINTLFFTTLPMGMTATEQLAWFYHGGGMDLMKKTYAKHGLLAFPGGNTGNQMGGWFKNEIKTVDDLQGLKMRIPGLAGDVMKSLGVEVTNLPPGELFSALESGELDALEWVGPSLDLRMGFHKVAKFYYTGWHEPGTELAFFVNEEAFKKLPENYQDILTISMRLASYDTYIQAQHMSATNLKKLLAEFPDITVRSFPSTVYRKLIRETNKQLDELAANGDGLTSEILASIREYQQKTRLWTRFSDQAYINNAF